MSSSVFSRRYYPKVDFLFPFLSFETICDVLEQNNLCICSQPEDMDHVLRWYDIFENGSTCPYDIDSHKILHVRKADDALSLLEQNTSDFVMLVTEDTCFPEPLVRYKDRILHVYSPEGLEAAQVMVERVFMELLIWENRLNYAVGSKATLEELLNAGSSMLGNFLCLITLDGNVTACSTEAAAPQGNLNMLSSSAIIPDALHALIDWTDFQKAFPRSSLIAETIEIDGVTCIRIPIWMKTYAFGFAVMVCEHTPYSRGLERAFLNFSCYLRELTRKIWTREFGMQTPHLFTLNTLFEGTKLDSVSPESIFVDLGISENSVYKLVAMSARDCIAIGFEKVRIAFQRLHGGHCLVAPYEDLLIGLCYSEIDGSLLSHRRTEEDLARLVFEPYGITCTMSQVYPDIRDTHLALRQIQFIMRHRQAIETELLTVDGMDQRPALAFETVFSYCLMSQSAHDEELMKFSFSYSLLEFIIRADLENGTKNFALLWYYLANERNASRVAERMYMHRNTVVYRIKQIEKRFDFSLSDQFLREKLILEYRLYFITLGAEKLRQLFDIREETGE